MSCVDSHSRGLWLGFGYLFDFPLRNDNGNDLTCKKETAEGIFLGRKNVLTNNVKTVLVGTHKIKKTRLNDLKARFRQILVNFLKNTARQRSVY